MRSQRIVLTAPPEDREQQGVYVSYCSTKLRSQLAHDLTASTVAFGMHQNGGKGGTL